MTDSPVTRPTATGLSAEEREALRKQMPQHLGRERQDELRLENVCATVERILADREQALREQLAQEIEAERYDVDPEVPMTVREDGRNWGLNEAARIVREGVV